MPLDAWIVVAVLGLMMVFSWMIMIGKSRSYGAIDKANASFMGHFRDAAGAPLIVWPKATRSRSRFARIRRCGACMRWQSRKWAVAMPVAMT
jgi:biopolymer transport protein ExbB/TolQ